jgi:hypothetical protein
LRLRKPRVSFRARSAGVEARGVDVGGDIVEVVVVVESSEVDVAVEVVLESESWLRLRELRVSLNAILKLSRVSQSGEPGARESLCVIA